MQSGNAGGAATAGGVNYEACVAAWFAAQILAESESLPFGLPVGCRITEIHCQVAEPVDDLHLFTSDDRHIFIQVKKSIDLSDREGSEFDKTIDQFVRQMLASSKTSHQPAGSRDQLLDPDCDRFVLACGPESSSKIREALSEVLKRLRDQPQASPHNLAKNNPEKKAIEKTLACACRNWQTHTGCQPTNAQVNDLLRMIWVDERDVFPGGAVEAGAIDLLQTHVVSAESAARTAWSELIKICMDFARRRSGGDLATLRQVLSHSGISLKAPRSYQEDIDILRRVSHRTIVALADQAEIRWSSLTLRVERSFLHDLSRLAPEDHLLLIGDPGVGKTGLLHDLVKDLVAHGREVVLLAVDRLDAGDSKRLRESLGLQHELVDVLANWIDDRPSVLIIDAFDAARRTGGTTTLVDTVSFLMRKVPQWKLIVSIRKFDLRYNQSLRDKFPGRPPIESNADAEFSTLRHFNVTSFTPEEREQIQTKAPTLWKAALEVERNMKEEAWLPFHLRLLADVLDSTGQGLDLHSINTQLDLLEQFWSVRVSGQPDISAARISLLRRITEEMVTARQLDWKLRDVTSEESELLEELTSDNVLSEPQIGESESRRFAHHILADYIIGRLVFCELENEVVERLTKESDLLIAFRPSISFALERVWDKSPDRIAFWKTGIRLQQANVRAIGKTICPATAAKRFQKLSDARYLLEQTADHSLQKSEPASELLRHLVGAAVAAKPEALGLVGPQAPGWCALAAEISGILNRTLAGTLSFFLANLLKQKTVMEPAQLGGTGQAARNLLEYYLADDTRRQSVPTAIGFVAHSFDSNPHASSDSLRRFLKTNEIENRGHETLHPIARSIKTIIQADPAFAAEIYHAAFSHEEKRDDLRPLGGQSQILPLTSTIKQHYEMAQYRLCEGFRELLEKASAIGTTVAIRVIGKYYHREKRSSITNTLVESFDIQGVQMRLHADHSHIWDSSSHLGRNDPFALLRTWESFLQTVSKRDDRKKTLRTILDAVGRENELAVVWKRMLRAATHDLDWLGRQLKEALWAIPILTCDDTRVDAGNLISQVIGQLGPDDQMRIERAVLSLCSDSDPRKQEVRLPMRNRLLGCIPEALIQTEEAKAVLDQLHKDGGPPPNQPLVQTSFGAIDHTAGELIGISDSIADAEPNRRIREIAEPVATFHGRFLNEAPTLNDFDEILPKLHQLKEEIGAADRKGVHPKQRTDCWGTLIGACATSCKTKNLDQREKEVQFLKEQLLQASNDDAPQFNKEVEEEFDNKLGWSTSTPRIEAAEGLIRLSWYKEFAGPEVLNAVEELSRDLVGAVRFQIAIRMTLLAKTAPELMWKVIKRFSETEPSRQLLNDLVSGPLRYLARHAPNLAIKQTLHIHERAIQMENADELRSTCSLILLEFHLFDDRPLCDEFITRILDDPLKYDAEAADLPRQLRSIFTAGPTTKSNPAQDCARKRAFDIASRLASFASERILALQDEKTSDQKEVQSAFLLADNLASELYFASGVMDNKHKDPESPKLSPQQQKRFLNEFLPAMRKLSEIGHPHVAYRLLETITGLAEHDPTIAIIEIRNVVRHAKKGLSLESLAQDHVVEFAERFLVEHRDVLRDKHECSEALLDLLDVFVEAGWTRATAMTYRLHEMYR